MAAYCNKWFAHVPPHMPILPDLYFGQVLTFFGKGRSKFVQHAENFKKKLMAAVLAFFESFIFERFFFGPC